MKRWDKREEYIINADHPGTYRLPTRAGNAESRVARLRGAFCGISFPRDSVGLQCRTHRAQQDAGKAV